MAVLQGEVLPPENIVASRAPVRGLSNDVAFWPTTFEGEVQEFTIIPGLTIEQIVGLAIPERSMWPGVTVWLKSGHGLSVTRSELLPEYWGKIIPNSGIKIEISYMPMGEDGGKILRGVLMIVIAVAAFYTGGLAAGALGLVEGSLAAGLVTGLVAGAVGAIGMMAVNALVPVRSPVSSVQDSPTSSTGFSNRLAFGEPIPTIHGKLRIYPNMAAQSYFESVGDDRYQRALFLIGRGPCELSDFRIGGQALEEFEDVELEIMQGWDDDPVPTLYQREVSEEAFGTILAPATPEIFQTAIDTIEAQIDFFFSKGLITYDSKGRRQSRSVAVNIEYRAVGAGTWLPLPFDPYAGISTGRLRFPFHGYGFGGYSGYGGYYGDYGAPVGGVAGVSHSFSAKSDTPIIRSKKFTFPAPGQYEIRCQRTTAAGDDQTRDEVQFAILRSFKNTPPVTISGLCLVALRLRLTGQKSSQVSNFNCVVQKLSAYHNGTAWVEPVTTRDAVGDMSVHRSRSPAAAFADVFRGTGVRRSMPDNRLDMTSIQEWWNFAHEIDARTGAVRYTYDAVILGRTTVGRMIEEICTVGRARFVSPNGQYGVMRDRVQSVPVNMFTARNSKNLSGSFNLGTPVHGIKIKFSNEDKDGQEETYVIYADGYDATTGTDFEELSFRGIVNVARLHEFGRYLIAVMALRPETLQITTYVDAMHNKVGDFVVINHDVPRHGLSAGRVVSLTTDINNDITSITLDEVVTMAVGVSYAVSIRRPSKVNMVVNAAVNTVVGDQQLLTFTTPIAASLAVLVGDLVSFGEADKVTRDVVITGIRHAGKKDYVFEITCVDLANEIHAVESETFPVFDNSSTPDPEITPPGVVTNLSLTENIIYPAGVAKSEVWATWTAPVGIPIAQFEIYEDFAGEFTLLGTSQDNRYRLPGDLVVGETITIRVVAISLTENKFPVRLATSATILLDGIADVIAALTGLAVTALPEALKINWNASAVLSVKGTHLYRATTDVQPATPYKSFPLPVDEFRDDIGSAAQTYFYWVRAYDQDDVVGPWNATAGVSGVTGAAAPVNADQTDYTDDRIQNAGLQLNTDGTMSYWNGTSWINLGATTISGLGYIGALDANKITDTNQLTDGAGLGSTAAWGNVSSRPTTLAGLNAGEGSKLSGIASGATVGASWSGNITGQPSDTALLNTNTTPADIGFTGDLDANKITNTSQLTDGAGLGSTAAWANVSSRPTTLAGLNAGEGSKLSGIALGATAGASWGSNIAGQPSDTALLNTNTTPADIGFTGDLDANKTTNTTQLTDGAGLGSTAAWANVSSRPTTLAGLNAGEGSKLSAIASGATQNTGALADLDGVDTAEIVDNAVSDTVATTLNNLNLTTTWQTILQGTINVAANSDIYLLFTGRPFAAYHPTYPNAVSYYEIQILRDSTYVAGITQTELRSGLVPTSVPAVVSAVDSAASVGSHTYKVQIRLTSASTLTNTFFLNTFLLQGLKK